MADADDQISPHVCSIFESQTWRRSLCKNCFHTLEEHSDELLAKEAEAVAKGKAAGKMSVSGARKSATANVRNAPAVDAKNFKKTGSSKELETEKEKSPKDFKGKSSANKDSSKEDGKLPLTKDIGREQKTTKLGTLSKSISEKHPTIPATTSGSSVSSSTMSAAKSPLKLVKHPTAAVTIASAASSQTTTTNSIATAATGTNSAPSSQKTPVSKARNPASTVEPKTPVSSKDKLNKIPDAPTRNSSIVTNNTKSANSSPGSKLSDKSVDPPQSLPPKGDPKSPRKIAEETVLTEMPSKTPKAGSSKVSITKSVDVKNENGPSDASKDTKTPQSASKLESKDVKLVNGSRSKTPLFSKDSQKNVKDVAKQIKSPAGPGENKTNSPPKDDVIAHNQDSSKGSTNITNEKVKVSPGLKHSPVKVNDIKGRRQECESALKGSTKLKSAETSLVPNTNTNEQRSASVPTNKETAELNKAGQSVKTPINNSETNMPGNNEGKETSKTTKGSGSKRESSPFSSPSKTEADKYVNSKDQGKDRAAGTPSERKYETVSDFSIAGKKIMSSASTLRSSRSATPSLTDTKSASLTSPTKASENKIFQTLKLDTSKELKSTASSLDKSKVSERIKDTSGDKGTSISSVKSPTLPVAQAQKTKEDSKESDKEAARRKQLVIVKDAARLTAELKDKEGKLEALTEQLSKMIHQVRALEEERDQLKGASSNNHKKDTEAILTSLREQLSSLESQCKTLEKDNQALIDQLHVQESTVKQDQEGEEENPNNVNLEGDLEAAEKELEDVKDTNKDLQTQIMEMQCEMDELYDHFRENEHEEFRELQKELDMTAKSCRMLQFKLRKAERRNEQFEEERIRYEEKLQMLQGQFDSKDAKNHIRILEEELRIAKEVSVRLHDELDIVEDKRNKALDDNRHLTDLLEHTDRRQFRLEMEIDKLRDIVTELKQQLAEARSRNNDNNNCNKELSPDTKVHSSIYTRSID